MQNLEMGAATGVMFAAVLAFVGVYGLGVWTDGQFPALWMLVAGAAPALCFSWVLKGVVTSDGSTKSLRRVAVAGFALFFLLSNAILGGVYELSALSERPVEVGFAFLAVAMFGYSKWRPHEAPAEESEEEDSPTWEFFARWFWLVVLIGITVNYFTSSDPSRSGRWMADSALRLKVLEWSTHSPLVGYGMLIGKVLVLPIVLIALWKIPTPGRIFAAAFVVVLFSLAGWWNLRPWLAGAGPESFAWGHLILALLPLFGMLALIAPRRDRLSRAQTMGLGIWAAVWLVGPAFPNWPN